MADSKITALAAISTVDPTADPLVIVDVSDTSMAASGTTKKSTINQLLGAGGTATLASATITGDLTVDTNVLKVDSSNNRVGIGTASPSGILHAANLGTAGTTADNFNGYFSSANRNANLYLLAKNTEGSNFYFGDGDSNTVGGIIYDHTSNYMRFDANGSEQYRIAPLGVFSWFDGAGGTRMTLNSTGLGVGGSPSYKLDVTGPVMRLINSAATADFFLTDSGTTNGNVRLRGESNAMKFITGGGVSATIDSSGNVGVGVTPSAWSGDFKALQLGYPNFIAGNNGAYRVDVGVNAYYDGGYRYAASSVAASLYTQASGAHSWSTKAAGTAGNLVSFTPVMSLDASGNLGLGVTPSTSRFLVKGDGTNIPVKIIGTTGDTTIPHLVIDKKDNNTTTSQLFIQFVVADNGAGSGQINANGVNQAAFGTYSDSRLKKNIVSLPSQLANILSLRPVEFDYKDGNGHQIGFIAQEMQEVYADAVGEQEGFLTVSGWNKTEARLVSAIKELAAKVQALEAKLA